MKFNETLIQAGTKVQQALLESFFEKWTPEFQKTLNEKIRQSFSSLLLLDSYSVESDIDSNNQVSVIWYIRQGEMGMSVVTKIELVSFDLKELN